MPAFGSDPDDAPLVDSDFESSATSMFSDRAQESQPYAVLPEVRNGRGAVDAASPREKDANAYKATEIFDQSLYASNGVQQDSRRNLPVSGARRATATAAVSASRVDERPQPVATGFAKMLQRYLPALLIVNALLLIALILLLTLPGTSD